MNWIKMCKIIFIYRLYNKMKSFIIIEMKYLFRSPFCVSLKPVRFALLIFPFWVTKVISGIVADKPFS